MHTKTPEPPHAPAPNLVPEWLTLRQACRRSNLGRSTLYALLKGGNIRGKVVKTRRENVSGKRLILRDSLDAFLNA